MKAFRIYHIENGEKIYVCNRPGYWIHVSSDPEYAIPFLDEKIADEAAIFSAKHVAPNGERFVEKYEEKRKLARHKGKNQVVLAEMLWYFACSHVDYELIS